jgi:hypothetical protein
MSRTHHPDFFHCNNCGAEVSYTAKVCPECGADDETAWKDGINSHLVAEDDFDYDEVVAREVHGRPGKSRTPVWIIILAIVLAGIFILRFIF